MTEPTDPTLPTDRPATIAEYIAVLGMPRTFAEEIVIETMQRLKVRDAEIQDAFNMPLGREARLLLLKEQEGLWRAAMELYFALRAFREHGDAPPQRVRRSRSGDC